MNFYKKKVLIVNPSMNIGGIETFLINVMRSIDHRKYEIVFLTYDHEEYVHQKEILSLGGRIVRVNHPKKAGYFKYFNELFQAIKKEQPSIIHSNTHFNSLFVVFAAKIAGTNNIIVHSHASYKKLDSTSVIRMRNRIAIPIINLLSDYQIAASNDASRALFGDSKRATIVKNGIRVKDFIYSEKDREVIRAELGIAPGTHLIMHSARFHPDKNYTFLLDVFEEYLKIDKNSILLLLGDGESRKQIESYAKLKGLYNNIIFAGFVKSTAKYYSAADIFVLPSHSEGLGIVLIEAQSNGLYCIASKGVPIDADVTGNVSYLSLSLTKIDWAKAIKNKIGYRDKKAPIKVIANGYDSKSSTIILENIYRIKS